MDDIVTLFRDTFNDMASTLGDVGLNIIGALIILVIGSIVATVLKSLAHKLLDKVSFDALMAKVEAQKFLPGITPTMLVVKIVFWLVYLFFIKVAVDVVNIEAVSAAMETMFGFIRAILIAATIVTIGALIAKFIRELIMGYAEKLSQSYAKTLSNVAYVVIMYYAVIIALQELALPVDIITNNINTIIIGIVVTIVIALGIGGISLAASITGSGFVLNHIKKGDELTVGDITGEVVEMNRAVVILKHKHGKTVVPISHIYWSRPKFKKGD